jgi:hypothetical protein
MAENSLDVRWVQPVVFATTENKKIHKKYHTKRPRETEV